MLDSGTNCKQAEPRIAEDARDDKLVVIVDGKAMTWFLSSYNCN